MSVRTFVGTTILSSIFVATSGVTAFSQSFTIQSGQTAPGQDIADDFSVGRIQSGGSIVTTGGVEGVDSDGNNVLIENMGTITTENGDGVELDGDRSTVRNDGTIRTTGAGSGRGIRNDGDDNTVINNGTIETSGGAAHAIRSDGDRATIVNRGTITANAGGAHGLRISGENTTVTNSGTIIANQPGSAAIIFRGGARNPTLCLEPGSVIVGPISNQAPGTFTLNVANGMNLDTTIATGQPDVLNTNGAPFVQSGNQVLVLDPTGFGISQNMVGTLTQTLHNSVNAGGSSGNSVVEPMVTAMTGIGSEADDGWRAFMTGFGNYGVEEGDGIFGDIEAHMAGGFAGMETGALGHGLFGFFAGAAVGDSETQFDTYDTQTDSVFGGGYYKQDYGSHRIHLAFAGGQMDFDQDRTIANNLVASGVEVANADYDGWFISPSASIFVPLDAVLPMVASARVHYTGLFLDGYTETGNLTPLTVSGQDVHQLGGRVQLAMPFETTKEDGANRKLEFRFGADGRYDVGTENVNATLAATPINFDATLDDQTVGFAGATFSASNASGTHEIGFSIEGHTDFAGTYGVTGSATATFRF